MTESVLITTADLESPGPFIIYVNPAFENMTGYDREEVIGKLSIIKKMVQNSLWSGQLFP